MTNYSNWARYKYLVRKNGRKRTEKRLSALEINVRRMSLELSEIQALMGRNSFQSLLNSLEDVQKQREARKDKVEIPLFSDEEI